MLCRLLDVLWSQVRIRLNSPEVTELGFSRNYIQKMTNFWISMKLVCNFAKMSPNVHYAPSVKSKKCSKLLYIKNITYRNEISDTEPIWPTKNSSFHQVSRDRSQRKQILQFCSLAFATVGCSHQKIRKILAEPNSARWFSKFVL